MKGLAQDCHFSPSSLFFFLFCFVLFFRAAPTAYGNSQAIGQMEHSNARSLTHWGRPGIEPASSWILVGFVNHWAMKGTPPSSSLNCRCIRPLTVLTIICYSFMLFFTSLLFWENGLGRGTALIARLRLPPLPEDRVHTSCRGWPDKTEGVSSNKSPLSLSILLFFPASLCSMASLLPDIHFSNALSFIPTRMSPSWRQMFLSVTAVSLLPTP